jgi:hypothetical protein
MGEEPSQIERTFEENRDELGRNVHELQFRVKSMTDWRYHFGQHPWTGVGVAFAGGLLLAQLGRGTGRHEPYYGQRYESYPRLERQHRSSETMSGIKTALLALAGKWTKEFLSASIPGFHEEFHRHSDARHENDPRRMQ